MSISSVKFCQYVVCECDLKSSFPVVLGRIHLEGRIHLTPKVVAMVRIHWSK